MFGSRTAEYDSRISAITDHLEAIQRELGRLGKSAGRNASANAVAAGNQIADAIGPILNDIVSRFRRGQRYATDEAASLGSEAARIGTEAARYGGRVGADALGRITQQSRQRPLLTLAIAIGVGILIGAAGRRS